VSSPKSGFPEPLSPDLQSGRYRRRVLTDNIFIKYVNSPLENDPTALHDIYDLMSLSFSISPEANIKTRKTIDLIIKFSEFNNYIEANQHREKLEHTSDYGVLQLESAFSDVYGYMEADYCLKGCLHLGGIDKILAIGPDRFNDNDHIKCFECDQKYVQYVVNEIIARTAFSEIVGLPNFLAVSRLIFRTGFSIEKSKDGQNEIIEEKSTYDPFAQELSFGIFLGNAVSYSLGNFLARFDYKKIKHCPYCEDVFIAKSISRTTRCYKSSCEKAYQRDKKRKQRANDPVKYI
jgi:hypothetical protein